MRPAETYRGARRNRCLREEKGVWSSAWYYGAHMPTKKRPQITKIKRAYEQAKSVFGMAPQVVATPKQVRPTGRGQ